MFDSKDQNPEVEAETEGKAEQGKPEKGKFNSGRRNFMANTGMYTAGLMATGLLGACDDDVSFAGGGMGTGGGMGDGGNNLDDQVSDAAVLQFALNLEYLEAEYYLRATTGMGLPDNLIQADGITSGPGSMPGDVLVPKNAGPVSFNSTLSANYANEIAADERDHVAFLRTALKQAGVPVPARPKIDLNGAFDTAATAAQVSGGTLNPFANELSFFLGAFIFEDVGVTAYKGGAQFLKNETYLTAAAGILAAEAYHAGLVRTLLTAKGMDVRGITDAISKARDSVAAPNMDKDQGTTFRDVTLRGQTYPATNIAPLDKNGIAFSRTVPQVHNVVYLTAQSVSSGGFFPNGTIIPANPALSKSG